MVEAQHPATLPSSPRPRPQPDSGATQTRAPGGGPDAASDTATTQAQRAASSVGAPAGGSALQPPAWQVLELALRQRRPVHVAYHGHHRLVCPHALGFKNGRAKVLAYQTGGTTSTGPLPADPRQRWRSMFVDQIEHPTITHGRWRTADNYRDYSSGIDYLVIAIDHQPHRPAAGPPAQR